MVLAGKDRGPLVRISKSAFQVRSWIDDNLGGWKRRGRCHRLVNRIDKKLRQSFNDAGEVICQPPKVAQNKPVEFPEDDKMARKWPKDPLLQINKMTRNFRKIANDYTKECRQYGHYLSLADKIEEALQKGLHAVLSKPIVGSGDHAGE